MLAEHGMVKEIYELQEARAKAHEQMMKAAEKTDLHTIRRRRSTPQESPAEHRRPRAGQDDAGGADPAHL